MGTGMYRECPRCQQRVELVAKRKKKVWTKTFWGEKQWHLDVRLHCPLCGAFVREIREWPDEGLAKSVKERIADGRRRIKKMREEAGDPDL